MLLICEQINQTDNSTVSTLSTDAGEFLCFIIEDGFRPKKVYGQTRISAGIYDVIPRFKGGHFRKYKKQYNHDFSLEIANVPDFSNILIHIGNTVNDTKGCLLTNSEIAIDKNGNYCGSKSALAYLNLYEKIASAYAKGDIVQILVKRKNENKQASNNDGINTFLKLNRKIESIQEVLEYQNNPLILKGGYTALNYEHINILNRYPKVGIDILNLMLLIALFVRDNFFDGAGNRIKLKWYHIIGNTKIFTFLVELSKIVFKIIKSSTI